MEKGSFQSKLFAVAANFHGTAKAERCELLDVYALCRTRTMSWFAKPNLLFGAANNKNKPGNKFEIKRASASSFVFNVPRIKRRPHKMQDRKLVPP